MLHYLFIGYIVIYCIFAIVLFIGYARIVPDEEKKTDKPWETPLDLILVAVGLAGMIFLLINLQSTTLKAVWRPLSIVLAVTQLYLNSKGRLDMLRSGATKPEIITADISTLLLLLPSIGLNIYYGFR